MAAPGRLAHFFLIFFFLGYTHADKCSAGCYGAFKPVGGYLPATGYTYSVEGLAKVSLSGADGQTNVKLIAEVVVSGLGQCANILKINSIQIIGPDGTKYPTPRFIEKPIRFTLQDGVLGSDICSEEGDSRPSLNIKRAILSMLQTATKYNTEVDVFGVCPTSFKSRNDGPNVVINKYRDLNSCAYREQGKHDLVNAIYNPNAEIKSTHILDSNLRVETQIKNGVVEKVEALEDYLYMPFSVGSSGAKANVVTKLQLKGTKPDKSSPASCIVPKSIIFENPYPLNTEHSNVVNIQTALQKATQSLGPNVDSKSASVFVQLVKVLRGSSKADLENIYNQIKGGSSVKDNTLSRRVFLDALFRAGTSNSIEYCIQLLQAKELNLLEERLALISLATVKHVDASGVAAATRLLDVKNLPNDVYLSVGALGGAYCRDHTCHGASSQDANIAALQNKMATKLATCKTTSKKAETELIYVLKGIKNIHHLEDPVAVKIATCASDKSVKTRVRVAALEAFSADACIKQLKSTAWAILKNRQEDSEVRIKAYLALLDCPSATDAGELKKLLDEEPVYQVGSYITSSLKNIRASANPSRAEAKKYFANISFKKQFPIDPRKYSQNFEMSYDHEMFGVGSVVDGNVIYSQDSFLPRSANLNLTTELFGRSVNLIELGYRQGNLDRVIEEYFGPHGKFNIHTPQQIYTGTKKTILDIFDKVKERMERTRGKRSVLQQTNSFGKNLKTDIQPYTGNIDLDIFLKSFGSEVFFLSLGDDKPTTFGSIIDKFFDFIDSGVTDAKKFAHEIRNHMILLDSELGFPTMSGFAIKLNVDVAATSRVQFDGNVDVKQLMKDPKNSKIDITLIPSANVEATGTLLIDADVVAAGLKVISSLHTSTGSRIITKLTDGGLGFDMELGLPLEKQELISLNHELVFVTRPKGQLDVVKELKFDSPNRYQFAGCFDQLASSTGLTLCCDLSAPFKPSTDQSSNKKVVSTIARGPLSGPSKLSIRLEKEQLDGLHIIGRVSAKKEGQRTMELSVEAKGPKKDRKITFIGDVTCRDDLRAAKVTLKLADKVYEAETAFTNNDHEKSLLARATDKQTEYLGKIGVLISGSSAKQVYKPVLIYKMPGIMEGSGIQTDGTITKITNGDRIKLMSDGLCLVNNGRRLAIDGWVQFEPKAGESDLKLTFDKDHASFKGKYSYDEHSYEGKWEMHNSMNKNFDFNIDVKASNKDEVKQLNLVFVHGPSEASKTNRLTYSTYLKALMREREYEDYEMHYKNQLSYPLLQLEYKAELEIAKNVFKGLFNGNYEKSNADFELNLLRDMKNSGDFFGKLTTKLNNKGLSGQFKYDDGDDKGNFATTLELFPGGKHESTGTINYLMKENDVNVGFSIKYKNSAKPDEYKFDTGLVCNLKVMNAHNKVSVGAKDLVDFVMKINKGDAPSGNVKLMLKDFVKCDGQFKVNGQDKKGNGVLLVAFLKGNRKIKFDSTFLISKPNYNMNLDVYYDFEKDNSKKIVLTTTNNLANNHIDSKSSLSLGENKLEHTFKGELVFEEGPFLPGKQKFLTTLTHSNGRYLSWEVDRKVKVVDVDDREIEGEVQTTWIYVPVKNSKPYKLTLNGKVNTNEQIDLENHIVFVTPSGEDINSDIKIKEIERDFKDKTDYQINLTGSMLKNPISAALIMERDTLHPMTDKIDIKYKFKGSVGAKSSIDADGILFYHMLDDDDMKYKNDLSATVKLPFEKLQSLKVDIKEAWLYDEGNYELKSLYSFQTGTDALKIDFDTKGNKKDGNSRLLLQVPGREKIIFTSKFKKYDETDDACCKFDTDFNVEFGANEKFSLDTKVESKKDERLKVIYTMYLPSSFKAHCVKGEINGEKKGRELLNFDVSADVDGKFYKFVHNVDHVDGKKPKAELIVIRPDKPQMRFFLQFDASVQNNVKGVWVMENFNDFNLATKVDATHKSDDEFIIKIDIDCPKLNLKKVNFEATSEAQSKGVKKIQFKANEEGKPLLSGSTTYTTRNEGGKSIIEGSGTLKLRDQQKQTSFKYIKDVISETNNNGVAIFLDVVFGEKSTVVEYKRTNMIYLLSTKYCEEKKQCAHIDIENKLESPGFGRVFHNLQLTMDLKKLGIVPEFGIKSSTELDRSKLPVHSHEVHLNLDTSKYSINAYAKPDKSGYVTAYTVNLPHRVISLESSTVGTDQKPFPFSQEVYLYLNKKNEPKSYSGYKITANRLDRGKNQESTMVVNGLLTSPCLGRDLKVSYEGGYNPSTYAVSSKVVLDCFKSESNKVEGLFKYTPVIGDKSVSYDALIHVNGKGVGFDLLMAEDALVSLNELKLHSKCALTLRNEKPKEVSLDVNMNRSNQKIILRSPTVVVLNVDNTVKSGQGVLVQVDGSVCVLEQTPILYSSEVRTKPQYLAKVSFGPSNTGKLALSAMVEPKKIIELKAAIEQGKTEKNLAYANLRSEGKSLKTGSGIEEANIKEFVSKTNQLFKDFVSNVVDAHKRAQEQVIGDAKKTITLFKDASVDVSTIVSYFSGELNKISAEFQNDKALQKYIKPLSDIVQVVLKTVSEIMKTVNSSMSNIMETFMDTYQEVTKVVREKIVPTLTDLYAKVSTSVADIVANLIKLVTHYVSAAAGVAEKYTGELKPLLESLNAIVNDIIQVISSRVEEVVTALKGFCDSFKEQLKDLPVVSTLQEKFKELEIQDKVIYILISVAPTDETADCLNQIMDYVGKKIQNQACDDVEELKIIAQKLNKAIDSLVKYLKIHVNDQRMTTSEDFSWLNTFKFNTIKTPKIGVPAVSVINYAQNEKLTDADDYLEVNKVDVNPLDAIPPVRLRGIIAGGQHIFTFDERHMTFPGNCKYVVSQDAVDGNFSIVLNLDKGKPKSIIVIDKSGSEVEVDVNKKLSYNGSPYGFPLVKGDIIAFKEDDSFTIKSQYGARVKCSLNLDLCSFEVSGFYTGKLRGLLGDGNNEPYDDFKLPNGKITNSEAEFGNSYALTSGCPQVKTVDHSHNHGSSGGHDSPGICNNLFKNDKTFVPCMATVGIDNYRQACEHATKGLKDDKAKKEGCLIARAYALACQRITYLNLLPSECLQCSVDGKAVKVGDDIKVSTPGKQADVVLAVETTKANEKTYKELVVPMMAQIVDEFKKNKVDDVKVYLVGITPNLPYPVYYDINNNKLQGAKIEFKSEQRSAPWQSSITTDIEKLDKALNDLAKVLQQAEIELGLNSIHWSYARLGKLNWRPAAVKTVIMVHSEPCDEAKVPLIQWFFSAISEYLMTEKGIVAHIVTPLESLKVDGVKQQSQVVGFSSNNVFLMGDKKRGLSNANLASKVDYDDDDVCLDQALETYGNVYSSKNFVSCNANQRKSFISMMSQTIVDSLVRVKMDLDCECERNIFSEGSKVNCEVDNRTDERKNMVKK